MRVVLVEDDATLGGAMRDHLVAHGHLVDWVTQVASAPEVRSTISCDLVLLDLNLPDGQGPNLLKSLRESGEVVPVVILTAMDQLTIRMDGLKAGADDYLIKPFDLGYLIALLAAVERGSLPLRSRA